MALSMILTSNCCCIVWYNGFEAFTVSYWLQRGVDDDFFGMNEELNVLAGLG